jgi:hypothetical protein
MADSGSAPAISTGSQPKPVRSGPFWRCWWAFREWLAHTLLTIGVIACIWALDRSVRLFMNSDDPQFFGILPVKWIFQAGDCAVFLGLSYLGVRAALAAYRGQG